MPDAPATRDQDSAHHALRAATREQHERLDNLFAGFDLADPARYHDFLIAHAMALPAIEAALDAGGFAGELPDWPERRRGDAIAADLAALGGIMPPPLPAPALDDAAARWGAAYVVEGSRLGGVFLARRIPDDLPKSYLGTPQPAGRWRSFLSALDDAVSDRQDRAIAGESARATFALFEAAGRRLLERA